MKGYLYHYTTLDKLALILKSGAIRFKPLDTMDDLQECKSKGIKNAGQFIFVSSWTDLEEESIPMWKMYSNLESGVRIALPVNPFEEYNVTVKEASELYGENIDRLQNGNEVFRKSLYPVSQLKDKNFFSPDMLMPLDDCDDPIEVEYTSDKEKLYPDVLIDDTGGVGIDLGILGKYKNEAWSFQSEWRYKLSIFPGTAKDFVRETGSRILKQMIEDDIGRPCDFYDRKLKAEALSKMEIVKAPCFSESSEILLNALLMKFSRIRVTKSSLADKIR